MSSGDADHRLEAVDIDGDSLAPASREVEQERRVAIHDLLEGNLFHPEGAERGPYRLKIGLIADRLALDVTGPAYEKRHLLSLNPLRPVVRDYYMICESYHRAIRDAAPSQIEALDMGRRGLHDQGSELLRERLAGKVRTDKETARRLFTLICALHWRR